ncbi:hypothetical protein [Ensifer soli]|uniref:hypothetical protein n=1 Tax=Ciceribacter sp. sgz301302 TaxID=3342379 RepID=UPI0035BA92BC
MDDRRPDSFTMIGLHKLASQFGDGLVPELYELLAARAQRPPNVTDFPVEETRPPLSPSPVAGAPGRDNVIRFPPSDGCRARRRERA